MAAGDAYVCSLGCQEEELPKHVDGTKKPKIRDQDQDDIDRLMEEGKHLHDLAQEGVDIMHEGGELTAEHETFFDSTIARASQEGIKRQLREIYDEAQDDEDRDWAKKCKTYKDYKCCMIKNIPSAAERDLAYQNLLSSYEADSARLRDKNCRMVLKKFINMPTKTGINQLRRLYKHFHKICGPVEGLPDCGYDECLKYHMDKWEEFKGNGAKVTMDEPKSCAVVTTICDEGNPKPESCTAKN